MADKNPSTNHDLPRPAPGTFDGTWGTDVMNDDMTQKLEERLIARDLEANLSNYTPYDGAIFIATDTGAVYDGNGTDWKKAERDFDTVSAESVNADVTNSEEYQQNGNNIEPWEIIDAGGGSLDVTIDSIYSRIKIIFYYDAGNTNDDLIATVNNDTNSNYNWENGASDVTGDTKFVLCESPASYSVSVGEAVMSTGFPRQNLYGNGSDPDRDAVIEKGAYNSGNTDPLNSIQVNLKNRDDGQLAILGSRL